MNTSYLRLEIASMINPQKHLITYESNNELNLKLFRRCMSLPPPHSPYLKSELTTASTEGNANEKDTKDF
jgi:hypothetical protein